VHATPLIIAPEGGPARGVVRRSSRLTACAYSRFSVQGWGEISDGASREFSLQLCDCVLKGSDASAANYESLSQEAFANVAVRYEPDFPEWMTCEFVMLTLSAYVATLVWVGEAHGVIKYNGTTVAEANPQFVLKTMPSGRQMAVVTNCLPLKQGERVAAKSVGPLFPGGQALAWVGSAPLNDSLENELRRVLASIPRRKIRTQERHAAVGELQGVALSF
jgi:hypothetical protein